MWGQVGRFGLTGDRVDESQIRAGIGELGRVEMFQQMSDCAVGPRVRHRMDVHAQDPLFHIGHQVGLRAKQIAQEGAGVVCPDQFLTHDLSQRRLSAVGNHLDGVHQLLAAGGQALELFGFRHLVPREVVGRFLRLLVDVRQFFFELFDLFHQFGFAFLPFDLRGLVGFWMQCQGGEAGLPMGQLGLDRALPTVQFPPLGINHNTVRQVITTD